MWYIVTSIILTIVLWVVLAICLFIAWEEDELDKDTEDGQKTRKVFWALFSLGTLVVWTWPVAFPAIVVGGFLYGIKQAFSLLPKRSKNVGEEDLTPADA